MHATVGRIARPDGNLERGEREHGIDRSADRVAHHATRPGVEDRRQIDEADSDSDIGDVRYSQLVGAVDDQIALWWRT